MAPAPMRDTSRGVTVGIPVYNEAGILVSNVRRVLDHLARLDAPYQLLIGSNGSIDATVRLGHEFARTCPAVDFFHLPTRGVGLAFREFVRRARYPVLVSLDMDLSSDLAFVERALALTASHDIVVGSKKLALQRRSLGRRLGSSSFLWVTRRLTGLPYDDYSIGAKAYRVAFLRQHLEAIDAGSSYVLDLCHAAARAGGRVTCVPVPCEDRRASKFSLPHEACYKFRRLFELWWRTNARTSGAAAARFGEPLRETTLVERHRP